MEGPSLIILKEELKRFEKKKVLVVSGNTKQPKESLEGKTLKKIVTWGKTIYQVFSGNIVTRTHFLLFGSYRIDDPKDNRIPRIKLEFPNGIVYFYSCSFLIGAKEQLDELDHRVDVLSNEWDEKYVSKLLPSVGDPYLCDLFLDQNLFAGSGNIVKNEVLFNLRRHPLTRLSEISPKDKKKLIHAIRTYCENFYEWKKKFELRKHWQVYRRFTCKICERKLKREKIGKWKRSTFYCPHCQNKKLSKNPIIVHEVLPIKEGGPKEKRLDH
jgi:endonuclease-8